MLESLALGVEIKRECATRSSAGRSIARGGTSVGVSARPKSRPETGGKPGGILGAG